MSHPSRRDLLTAGAASLIVPTGLKAEPAEPDRFPSGFLWGASTAAYQIEGAVKEDGRGPSIWDVYAHRPGKIQGGDTGDVACDHYHRWPGDFALLKAMNASAYRFSVAWPRVFPEGIGRMNPKGLDVYDRMVDVLLKDGIRPFLCLYHWDLPQALHEKGGWHNRDIAWWFAEYAQAVGARLGDRVKDWTMLNEPSVVAMFGYAMGSQAPGLIGRDSFFAAIHQQNRAQGAAIAALRAQKADYRLGTVLSLQPTLGESQSEADGAAARLWDALWNRGCLDPLLLGRYPTLLAADYEPLVKPGDLENIHQPVDFLGLNYYSRMTVKNDPGSLFGIGWGKSRIKRVTAMGWTVEPDGLFEQLRDLREHYGNPPVLVTENGAAYKDHPDAGGHVEDKERIAYLRDHLTAVRRAMGEGCAVFGYLVWSLLDNFEWSFGYSRRFGLVRVDYRTQVRTPKASFHWMARVAREGKIV